MKRVKYLPDRSLRTLLLAGTGLMALPLFTAPAAAQTEPSADTAGQDREIVVTAQKREQALQDVPISITVLGGEKLDSTNQSLVEELGRVPGVATVGAALGGNFISIRGVGASGTSFAGTGTVGYYLDSVPFGFIRNPLTPDASAYDLERVEVLRGPQGTLYGVNSQNGVIRVLTKDADLAGFEAKYRLGLSATRNGGMNYRGDAAINIPIITDKLAARIVAGYEDFDGWIDRPNRKDANDLRRFVLRGKINAQPTEELSIGLSAWHSETDSHAISVGLDNRRTTVVADEPTSEDYNIYALRIGYDFGGVSLTSSTSHMDYQSYNLIDFSYGPATRLTSAQFNSSVFSQEINLASTHDGPWQWTAGGIYRRVTDRFAQLSPSYPNPNGNRYNDYASSYAIFGELTRRFFDDRLELTGGLRYYKDHTRNRQLSNLASATAVLTTSTGESEKVSPRVVLTWLPSKDFTFYASYSEGFRGGFPQSPTVTAVSPGFKAVGPDNLRNYEMGSKGSFADGVVSYEAALFYIDYRGIQQSLQVNALNTAGGPIRVTGLINGTSASGLGAELGLTFRPSDNFSFGGNYAWNGIELDADIIPAVGAPLFFKSDRLTNSPEHTASTWFEARFNIGELEGNISGSLSYLSQRASRGVVGGVRVVTTSDETFTSRISAGVKSPHGWGLTLFVDNLNDYNGSPIPDAFVPPTGSYRIRPRTIGLQFDHKL